MRRSILSSFIVCAALTLTAIAWAASFTVDPTATDQGSTLLVQGTVSGLAPGDAVVRVRALGTANVTCVNPGGNEANGQNRNGTRRVTVNGVQRISAADIAAGTVSFQVTTSAPSLGPKAAGCPNTRWSARVDDVTFRTVTVRVLQGGSVVLTRTMTL